MFTVAAHTNLSRKALYKTVKDSSGLQGPMRSIKFCFGLIGSLGLPGVLDKVLVSGVLPAWDII